MPEGRRRLARRSIGSIRASVSRIASLTPLRQEVTRVVHRLAEQSRAEAERNGVHGPEPDIHRDNAREKPAQRSRTQTSTTRNER